MYFTTSASMLAVWVAVASAHMCLVNPKQRGSITGLDKAGSNDCILLQAPCGGRMAESPATVFKSGGNFTVIFQKNLDHWVKATPGYFSVALLDSTFAKELARVPDAGEPSLTLYTASGPLPDGLKKGNQVLQVTYVTKNTQAPPVFYQCADVMVM